MIALQILTNIILPVFLLVGLGALLDRVLPIDVDTLAKLSFYVFISAVVFLKLLDSNLDPARFGEVLIFALVHMALLGVISWQVFGLKAFRAERPVLVMSAIFYNSGNFGLPFAQLAFGDLGVSVMTILMMIQLIANFTIGLWLVGVGDRKQLIKGVLLSPVIWMIVLALLLHAFQIKLPQPVLESVGYLADGLIPVALITLGVQLSRSKPFGKLNLLAAATVAKLVAAPLLALGMLAVWASFAPAQAGQLGPILVAGSGLPIAVNVYILAAEYGKDPELSSQVIFWSTLLSALTLTAWLALTGVR